MAGSRSQLGGSLGVLFRRVRATSLVFDCLSYRNVYAVSGSRADSCSRTKPTVRSEEFGGSGDSWSHT